MKTAHTTRTVFCGGALATLLLALGTLSPAWAQPGPGVPAEADKLHVVLLVDGSDGNGPACLKDVEGMRAALEAAFAKDPQRLVLHDLAGKNPKSGKLYTPAEVMQYLMGLKVGKNDNVLVFHSGHGGILDRKGPEASFVLTIDRGKLYRLEIQKVLQESQPRAVICLTDCCSSFVREQAAANGQALQLAPAFNAATIRNLLLRPVGLVSVTAAEDGTAGIAAYYGPNPGQAGSAFSVALLRLWYGETTYDSWEQFFPALRTETGAASNGSHFARAFHLGQKAAPVQEREGR
jgi:hypothetical protein